MTIKSTRIYTENSLIDGFITVTEGKIASITTKHEGDFTDYGSKRIIPGIFDTHNHGTYGYSLVIERDTLSDAKRHIQGYLKCCAAQGVTSVFPTLSRGLIKEISEIVIEADKGEITIDGAEIAGIHSEGPWLNRTGEKGIWVQWPEVSLDHAKQMVDDGQGKLKLVALAPEIEGIDPIIEYFLSQGVTVSMAHSNNNYEQAMEAYGKGITVATHVGNVMTGMHHRDVGVLGASLLNENVECEVICDGMHISLKMLEIFFKLKDYSRFMMISDCTPLSGAPVGKYKGLFPGTNVNVREDGFVLSDEGRLCGSSQPVLFGICNLVEKLGIPMETVVQMASLNPSRIYGLLDKKGSIREGKDADFVVITDDYRAEATYVRGRKVYDSNVDVNLFNGSNLTKIS